MKYDNRLTWVHTVVLLTFGHKHAVQIKRIESDFEKSITNMIVASDVHGL